MNTSETLSVFKSMPLITEDFRPEEAILAGLPILLSVEKLLHCHRFFVSIPNFQLRRRVGVEYTTMTDVDDYSENLPAN